MLKLKKLRLAAVLLAIFSVIGGNSCRQQKPGELVFAVGVEFYERPDGFKKLLNIYDFQPPAHCIKKMSIGLTYKALRNEQVDVAMGFATDGRIDAFGFVVLEDDKDFFPVYNPAPVVRTEILDEHPEIADILAPVAEKLSTGAMRSLNRQVDVEHEEARTVARDWLRENNLLAGKPGKDDREQEDRPTIVVGGKNFTEQYILAEMAAALLSEAGFKVKLQTGVGSVIARKSLLNDQIDLYYEYTGTAYTVFYDQSNPDIMRDPVKVYEWVMQEDAEKGLTWLRRVDFNNTYTLIMRKAQAQELGIASVSDLARYVNKFYQTSN